MRCVRTCLPPISVGCGGAGRPLDDARDVCGMRLNLACAHGPKVDPWVDSAAGPRGRGRRSEQALAPGAQDGLGPRIDTQLAVDVAGVAFDGAPSRSALAPGRLPM